MLDERDILSMLTARGAAREDLFAQARTARVRAFGDQVVVRAVIEVTNICRVDCDFCPMRRTNTRTNRTFHLTPDQIFDAATAAHAAGINVICLQGGEIPQTTKTVGAVLPAIRDLYGGEGVELLLNLGDKTPDEYAWLREQGATSYIIKHETADPGLHERMRHKSLESRLACIRDLLDLGYKVGSGMIVGLPGQSLESIVWDIMLGRDLGVHMMSASPFVPAPDTPLALAPAGDVDLTLNAMAAMRLVCPWWTIPSVSAMRATTGGGQLAGFAAGASAIVANFTPPEHRDQYLIYGRNRRVSGYDHVLQTIADAGLRPGRSVFVTPATVEGSR
jgi:biotin synthase